MKVLDTSVAVDHLRGNELAVQLLRGILSRGEELVASEVVRFELLSEVRVNEIPLLERFFSAITWLGNNEDISRVASDLARSHRRSHHAIDTADYFIAATAVVCEAELLTLNVKHFPMFKNLSRAY